MTVFSSLQSFGQRLHRKHASCAAHNSMCDNDITSPSFSEQAIVCNDNCTANNSDETSLKSFEHVFRQLLFKIESQHGYMEIVRDGVCDLVNEICCHFASKLQSIACDLLAKDISSSKQKLPSVVQEMKSIAPLCKDIGGYRQQVHFLKKKTWDL
jgi:hypothetical protein